MSHENDRAKQGGKNPLWASIQGPAQKTKTNDASSRSNTGERQHANQQQRMASGMRQGDESNNKDRAAMNQSHDRHEMGDGINGANVNFLATRTENGNRVRECRPR